VIGALDVSGNWGMEYAHRVAWELAHGQTLAPDGYVLHTCDVRACVNPAHLVRGTQKDNIRDAVRKGRHRGGRIRFASIPSARVS
jgi:hypothetical protein